MTPEAMKFWLDILHSPVALTLSGALVGAIFTFAGVWFKSRHDAKENQKAWERQEITRKEERLFQLKIKAYEDFADCYTGFGLPFVMGFAEKILPVSIRLVNYGSDKVRNEVHIFINLLDASTGQTLPEKITMQDPRVKEALNKIHDCIIEDIHTHHST